MKRLSVKGNNGRQTAEGKTKSATSRQLFAERLKLSELIKRCDFWF